MYISVRLTCIASLSPKVWGPPNKIWGTDLIRNMSVHVLLIWLTFTSTPNTYRDLRHRRILYSQCSSDLTVTTSSMGCWKMSASRHAGASFDQADQVEGGRSRRLSSFPSSLLGLESPLTAWFTQHSLLVEFLGSVSTIVRSSATNFSSHHGLMPLHCIHCSSGRQCQDADMLRKNSSSRRNSPWSSIQVEPSRMVEVGRRNVYLRPRGNTYRTTFFRRLWLWRLWLPTLSSVDHSSLSFLRQSLLPIYHLQLFNLSHCNSQVLRPHCPIYRDTASDSSHLIPACQCRDQFLAERR